MPTFPTYAKVSADGYSQSDSPIVERTEMDRGVPKQRKSQSDVLVTVSMKLIFLSKADAIGFGDWYYGEAGAGTVYFDWTDPIEGLLRAARVVANTLGPIESMGGGQLNLLTRTLQIEYLRSL